jgi:hypothetical protein
MRVGTKSLLFGYHQFVLHPILVFAAWWKLYGFPIDPRIWVGIFVHDLGYFGKPNMDGTEGKTHPFFGADVMHLMFDGPDSAEWYHFCLYHSRSLALVYFAPVSKLCYADKMAFLLYPKWLLRTLYKLSGEGEEYLRRSGLATWDEWFVMADAKNQKTVAQSK